MAACGWGTGLAYAEGLGFICWHLQLSRKRALTWNVSHSLCANLGSQEGRHWTQQGLLQWVEGGSCLYNSVPLFLRSTGCSRVLALVSCTLGLVGYWLHAFSSCYSLAEKVGATSTKLHKNKNFLAFLVRPRVVMSTKKKKAWT